MLFPHLLLGTSLNIVSSTTNLQHGFREKRSCVTQLVMLVNDLVTSIYKQKQIDIILLDFSKAFDKVSHEKVLVKMNEYGVRGNTLK